MTCPGCRRPVEVKEKLQDNDLVLTKCCLAPLKVWQGKLRHLTVEELERWNGEQAGDP